jgi:rod shape-determining protein MreD
VKRFIIITLEILICYLLQTTIFQWIALANVVPNLLLILTVSNGFLRGRKSGLTVGFFCGLLIDLCFGNIIGLYAFIYMVIGYANGFANIVFDRDDQIIPMILVGVSDLSYFFLYYVFNFLLRGRLNIFFYFTRIGLPEIVYTLLISIFLLKLLYIINKYLERAEKEEV